MYKIYYINDHMRYLSGEEKKEGIKYMEASAKVASHATCNEVHCGSVIVKNCEIIGSGYNGPPGDREDQRRCGTDKDSYHKKVSDKTCCMHAEHKAIIDALKRNGDKIDGSRLYFMRLDKDDNMTRAGKPRCTVCSKFALDSGVGEFVLWHDEGIGVYETPEYNTLSYQYTE